MSNVIYERCSTSCARGLTSYISFTFCMAIREQIRFERMRYIYGEVGRAAWINRTTSQFRITGVGCEAVLQNLSVACQLTQI